MFSWAATNEATRHNHDVAHDHDHYGDDGDGDGDGDDDDDGDEITAASITSSSGALSARRSFNAALVNHPVFSVFSTLSIRFPVFRVTTTP